MLRYALIFFIIALIAALLGFTGVAAGATEIAKILFFVFLVSPPSRWSWACFAGGPDISSGTAPTPSGVAGLRLPGSRRVQDCPRETIDRRSP